MLARSLGSIASLFREFIPSCLCLLLGFARHVQQEDAIPDDELALAIRWAFRERHFVVRTHALIEMRLDRLTEADVRRAGIGCELLEDYPDRPEGHMLLLLGYVGPESPIHLVVGCEAFERDWSKPLVLVTVYIPEPPAWSDERTRVRTSR